MKLNEKGFAFSTMLYGSITLIAIVLYVILNINKSSNDTTYYFGEELLKSLNECVTEEIALENCYSSGSNSCNAASYHACLGVSDNNSVDKGIIISEKLKELDLFSDIGLVEDQYENNRYIFKGDTSQNYIMYSGIKWRIVSIEFGGHLKLIDTNKLTSIAWDSLGSGIWGANTLYSMLNINYLSTLTDVSKIYQGAWYSSYLYPSLVVDYDINDLISQEENTPNDNIKYAKVGVLSVSDYIKATNNDACKELVFGENTCNCNSWLSQYKGWTDDINGEFGSDQEGFAFYFGDDLVNEKNNKVLYSRTNETHDVYPVIYLDRNSIYKSGTGTEQDPFILK